MPRRLGKMQTSWAMQYCGTPTDKPGPEQHSPLDRLTSTQEKKRNWPISNKNNKDTWVRGWGALSTKVWGKGILLGTVNQQVGWAGQNLEGEGAHPETWSGKACESGGGRKTPHERQEDPLPKWTVNKHGGWQEQQHGPLIRSRKACECGGGRKTPQERGEDPPPTWTVNEHAGLTTRMQCHLSHWA
jgi:hypothetical protein